MLVAKVIGSAVASLKLDALQSSKLLLVCPTDLAGNPAGNPFLAVDLVGAGEGELVMVSQGSSARVACGNPDRSPSDAAIVGILDSLRSNGETVFRKA
jgi:ethanolamine utilization protein EutN